MSDKTLEVPITIPDGTVKDDIMPLVEAAAKSAGLYISHIGGFTRVKYPGSVHWHFKRDKKEPGLIDATFWDVKAKFWLQVRKREPEWVQQTYPLLEQALKDEFEKLSAQ